MSSQDGEPEEMHVCYVDSDNWMSSASLNLKRYGDKQDLRQSGTVENTAPIKLSLDPDNMQYVWNL